MNYTLHQLKVFLKVVELQSVSRAAEELFLTQPGVSIQLKNFQEQFDIPLTEVIGRKLYVTEFGTEVASIAGSILEKVDLLDSRTAAFNGLLTGNLKLSIVSTGVYVMPYFLSGFLAAHPGIHLNMAVTNKSGVLGSMKENECDFGLVSIIPEALNVSEEMLVVNNLFLVGRSDNPPQQEHFGKASQKAQIKILGEIPLIYREPGSATRGILELFLEKHNIKSTNKIELTSNEAVKQAVLAGLGYSVMPLIGIRNEMLTGDLHIIPVEGFPISSKWRLIWSQQKTLSPVADAFLSYLKANKAAIINQHFAWIL